MIQKEKIVQRHSELAFSTFLIIFICQKKNQVSLFLIVFTCKKLIIIAFDRRS
jgi:hypothetical protein